MYTDHLKDKAVLHELADTCSTQHTLGFLARTPLLAVIALILCGIVILPTIVFLLLAMVALFSIQLKILEIPGEMMLFEILFSGFLISVAIIFFITSGIIFAWYYGLSKMYQNHFYLIKEKLKFNNKHAQLSHMA